MKRKFVLAALAAAALVAGVLAATVGTANAADSNCKVQTIDFSNNTVQGSQGQNWATADGSRVVTICEDLTLSTQRADVMPTDYSVYHVTVSDAGTFTTFGGSNLSPGKGQDLQVGAPGTLSGGYSDDFIAPSKFKGYNDDDSAAVNGNQDAFLAGLWDDTAKGFGPFEATHFSWTFKACSEKWVLAWDNKHGSEGDDNDITGKDCPSPTPSQSASATPTSTPTVTPTTPAPTPTTVTTVVTVTG